MNLNSYLNEFDIPLTPAVELTGESVSKWMGQVLDEPGPCFWLDCPGDIDSYSALKKALKYIQDSFSYAVIACSFRNQPSLPIDYQWLTVNLSQWSFFFEGDSIIGIWRKPRYQLENPKDLLEAELKLGYVVENEREYHHCLSLLEDPHRDNGYFANMLSALANYPVRIFMANDLQADISKEYPILICSSHLSVINQARKKVLGALLLPYVPDQHTVNLNGLESAGANGILTPSPAIMLQSETELPVYFLPQFMYPEMISRTNTPPDGILVTGSTDATWDCPERIELYRELSQLKSRAEGLNIQTWTKDGKKEVLKGHSGFRYQQFTAMLSRYKAVCFASDRWGYLVRKYYEIPGTWQGPSKGSPLMIAPQTYDTDAIDLVNGENFLALDMHHFWEQMEWVNSHPQEVWQIAQKGHQWYLNFIHRWHEEILPGEIDLILSE